MAHLFKHDDYRSFLKSLITENGSQRGYQAQLARAAECQPSYMSQVLSGKAELLPDQAAGLAEHFAFSPLETDYLVNLVMLSRASSQKLKRHLAKKLVSLRSANDKIENRIEGSSAVSNEVEKFYYSSWYWSAIHIATSVPDLQTPQALAEHFDLPLARVKRCLERLSKFGLVKHTGNTWRYAGGAGHLSADSEMTELNHLHWRQRALLDIQKENETSIHYTSVVSMSKQDIQKIREFFMKMITQSRKISDPSPPEDVVCVAFDFFALS